MKRISLNKYSQPDRQESQERLAESVERDPEPYLEKYVSDSRSFEGRYVCSDLMKEQFAEFAASNEARARYNGPVHNSAVVLADEQYSRAIADQSHPERDQAIFVTGAPGAGKTTAVLTNGEPAQDVRVIYEGQLANPQSSIPKIEAALEAGLTPTIVAINVPPEVALDNTLNRFEIDGRGATIHSIATIQSGLPDGLQQIRDRFGDQVDFRLIDRSNGLNNSTELPGWEQLDRLQRGSYEQIRDRLTDSLQQQFDSNRISDDAYRQAQGLATLAIGEGVYHEYGSRTQQVQAASSEEIGKLRHELVDDSQSVNSPPHLAPFVDELATALTADAALNVALPDTSPDNAGSTDQKGAIDDGFSMSIE
jgi:hypothetical protein